MRIHKSRANSHACGEQVASKATTGPQYQQIKLALDVHAASIVVGRMIGGAKPQPPQTQAAGVIDWLEEIDPSAPALFYRLLWS